MPSDPIGGSNKKGDAALRALRAVIEAAVAAGTVPGAVVLAARDGTVRFHEAFGLRQREPEPLPARSFTVYDVASLTKAVCTSVLTMKATASGRLGLDDRVQQHLPEFAGPEKETVTIRQLLCHASGLPAHRPFYEDVGLRRTPWGSRAGETPEIAYAAAVQPLINRPGAVSVYSDLGFILLGWILERLSAMKLDRLFRNELAQPLALDATAFLPTGPADAAAREAFMARHEIAPTERCVQRACLVHGAVHDLNAFAMGGVAGHAGLFSDAADLHRVAGALVSAWQGAAPGRALVPQAIIQEFWRPAGVPGSTWRLGWDGPAARNSQAGTKLSRAAVGHLGFTGCSLWIDPERAQWIIVLANRVHPVVRADPAFREFRAAVQDAAVDVLATPPILSS